MVRSWLLVIVVCSAAVLALSCGHGQILQSITISPTIETFGASNIPVSADAGLTVQLQAIGNYLYPPGTKDLTNQVTWLSNSPEIATVTPTGLVTATGVDCGGTVVSATTPASGSGSNAVITGSMTANVVCFTGTGPTLTVNFGTATGSGTVTSSPSGLSCTGNPCAASFTSGTTVVLTATPTSVFAGWSGCDLTSGFVCTVVNLVNNRTVTVTF
jgi:hypothetical protein